MNINKIHSLLSKSIGLTGFLLIILTIAICIRIQCEVIAEVVQFSAFFSIFIIYSLLALFVQKKKYGSTIQRLFFGNVQFLLAPLGAFFLFAMVVDFVNDNNDLLMLSFLFGMFIFLPALAVGYLVAFARLLIEKRHK